ncbi:MAG: PhzF family phenazine biosynthesis protein [Pseudomonadales bacterium]
MFPLINPRPCKKNKIIAQALGANPIELYKGRDDFLAVFESEKTVRSINRNFSLLAQLECRGLIVTAPGDQVDFVSRFFAPRTGVAEDPVTGSSHTLMVPYWAGKTGKTAFSAAQLSQRSGHLFCELSGSRVFIGGHTKKYLQGEIFI